MISTSKTLLALLVVLVVCGLTYGQPAARPDRGATLNRNYLVSDIENINLQNGGVQLSIPLGSLPPIAGGKLSWTVSAHYNSALWNVVRVQEEPLGTVWMPYVVDAPSAGGGWTIGERYSIQFRNANDDFYRIQYDQSSGLNQGEIDLLNNYQYWKVVLVSPDGSERELRPLDYTAYPGSQDFLRGYYNTIPSGSPMRYYSRDGSFMYAKISSITDWTVYMADGTRIIQTPDGVQRLQDTNGNKIKIFTDTNGTHYQDEQTTNREIRVVYDPAANSGQGRYRVFYPTVTGIEHYVDVNMGTTIVQGKTYPVQDFDVVNENICQRDHFLYTELQVVRDIVFPQTEAGQTRKFVFSYNSDTTESTTSTMLWVCNGTQEDYTRTASVGWGELSRVVAPPGTIQTAAYTDYSYPLTSEHSLTFTADDLTRQGVTKKDLHHDGIVETWTFDGTGGSGYAMTAPDGNHLSEASYCGTYGQPGCVMDKVGLSYRTRRPFIMTERHWINLIFSGTDHIASGPFASPFNPVVDVEYTTLLDANNNALKMSAKKFQHDYNGNVTQTIEYDWFDPALVSRDAEGVFDVSGFGLGNVPTIVDRGPAVVEVVLVREETSSERFRRLEREEETRRHALAAHMNQALNDLLVPKCAQEGKCVMGIFFPDGLATGLRAASPGLLELYSSGTIRNMPIINIRNILRQNGFEQTITRNRSGYLFRNNIGEEVRIMRRGAVGT
jgi:hypothetical protein